jgi:type VI protein secretion system component Hcp
LDSVVFEFPDQNAKGPKKPHSRIQLTNATVLQIRHIGGGQDEVSFVYEEISVSGGSPPLEARLTYLTAVG